MVKNKKACVYLSEEATIHLSEIIKKWINEGHAPYGLQRTAILEGLKLVYEREFNKKADANYQS